MPSSGGSITGSRLPDLTRGKGFSPISLTQGLMEQVRLLSVGRRSMYERAQTHRESGQLVPLSLCEEMTENETRLRDVLARYTDATTRR